MTFGSCGEGPLTLQDKKRNRLAQDSILPKFDTCNYMFLFSPVKQHLIVSTYQTVREKLSEQYMYAVQARVPAAVREMHPRSSARLDQTRDSGGYRAYGLYYLKIYMYFTNHATRERKGYRSEVGHWSWKKVFLEGISVWSRHQTNQLKTRKNLAASQRPQSRTKLYVWDFQRLLITTFVCENNINELLRTVSIDFQWCLQTWIDVGLKTTTTTTTNTLITQPGISLQNYEGERRRKGEISPPHSSGNFYLYNKWQYFSTEKTGPQSITSLGGTVILNNYNEIKNK